MRDPVLHRLAGTTASRLTSRSDSTPVFFRFTTLPEEIQIRILEHTDLVAPQDLEWTHESRLFGFTPNSRLLCRSALDRGMATREAQVFPVLENLNPCVTCTGGYGFPLVGEDRSCAQSNQCGCWVFPQALFSLCRKLRREAIRIFYSENHFIIHYQGDWKVGDLKLPHLSFLAFCKSQGAVPWLRSIQFELPCMATYKVLSTHRYNGYKIMTEWDDDINFLASEADLSRLTVTIGLFETHTNYRPDDQGSWISSLQKQRISDKLTKLHGLKDLFVHLSYFPIHLEPVMELERREKELEQKVMGDNYNAVARGKFSVSGRRHVQPDKYYFD
ncbi:MAG: hypothetical protein LQ342_004472 [Letrouitia transgressa]|nr:MAG: hypothetical protein LQ342_004472 [Letrouitia transgressa]